MIVKKKKKILYILAILWACMNIIPLIVVILGSFKNTNEIYMGPFQLPEIWSFKNYDKAILRSGVLKGIFNSFTYAIISVILIMVIALMAGFVLSRFKGKLIEGLNIYFILGILVPVQATFIPLVGTIGKLGMQNNPITMITIYVTFNLPMSILLITGYMRGISKEIDEAATIDGSGTFGIFRKMIVPLSLPAISTAGILAFVNIYNDLIFATLFISKPKFQTITQVVNSFSAQYNTDVGATLAAMVVAIIPMIVIFMCFQEKVIAGLSAGSVKG